MALAIAPDSRLDSRLNPPAAPPVLTFEQYMAVENAGAQRFELWYGQLVEIGMPIRSHPLFIRRLTTLFENWVSSLGIHPLDPGAPSADSDVTTNISGAPVVRPDLAIFGAERAHLLGNRTIQAVPDVIIEVLSKSKEEYIEHDEVRKFELYARLGVPVYVIVDADESHARVFVLREGAYDLVETLREGDSLTFDVLPGFVAPLSELFPRGTLRPSGDATEP
jgi:Uma2 family endonuclease